MQDSLPKPWPRPGKKCRQSQQQLGLDTSFFSAFVEEEGSWIRYDIIEGYFDEWKNQQNSLVAWWKVQRRPLTSSKEALEGPWQEMLGELYLEYMKPGSRQPIAALLLVAMVLQRKKLVQVHTKENGIFVQSLDGSLHWSLPLNCIHQTKHLRVQRCAQDICRSLGLDKNF